MKKPQPLAPRAREFRPVQTQIRSIDEKARTIEFVASNETVDRYGDIIRVAGWELGPYVRNPVFLWGHRSGDPPIGKTVAISLESSPPALVQRIQFATRDEYPFADTIYRLYKGGYLNAVSVGFMPKKYQPIIVPDDDGGEITGYEFLNQELFELSAVCVPANPDALGRAVEKGIISDREAGAFQAKTADYVKKCGEDNPPWAFLAPGVTFPAEEDGGQSGATASVRTSKAECPMGDDCPKGPGDEECPKGSDCPNAPKSAAAPRVIIAQKLDTFCEEGRTLARQVEAALSDIRSAQYAAMHRSIDACEGVNELRAEIKALVAEVRHARENHAADMAALRFELRNLRELQDLIRAAIETVAAKTISDPADGGAAKVNPTTAPDAPANEAPDTTPSEVNQFLTELVRGKQ